LVAAYGLDEGSGTTATDRTTNNNGSIAGATWTVGRYGSALAFNGVSREARRNAHAPCNVTISWRWAALVWR